MAPQSLVVLLFTLLAASWTPVTPSEGIQYIYTYFFVILFFPAGCVLTFYQYRLHTPISSLPLVHYLLETSKIVSVGKEQLCITLFEYFPRVFRIDSIFQANRSLPQIHCYPFIISQRIIPLVLTRQLPLLMHMVRQFFSSPFIFRNYLYIY